jgi:hypothetical protein
MLFIFYSFFDHFTGPIGYMPKDEGSHDTAESAGSDGKQNQVAEIKRDKPTVCEECEFKCFFP